MPSLKSCSACQSIGGTPPRIKRDEPPKDSAFKKETADELVYECKLCHRQIRIEKF